MLEFNKIYLGDCLDIMKQIPDKSIDLVLTDPPYGIGIKGKVGGGSKRGASKDFGDVSWDNEIPQKEMFDEIFRISKEQIIFGGNYFIEYFNNTPCFLVWYKRDGLPTRTFADAELAWTSFKSPTRVYNFRHDGFISDSKDKKVHPTQKPTELFKQIVADYSKEGMTILDPFAGSGTTAIACHDLKRNFICIEKEPEYVEISQKRLAEAKMQLSLF